MRAKGTSMRSNVVLWIGQVLLAVVFICAGAIATHLRSLAK
jgi:hypothetical protein